MGGRSSSHCSTPADAAAVADATQGNATLLGNPRSSEEKASRQGKVESQGQVEPAREEKLSGHKMRAREAEAEDEWVKVELVKAYSATEDLAASAAAEEIAASQEAVDGFLCTRHFKQLETPRRGSCGVTIYPLHVAVAENNPQLVRAMVTCGANVDQKNSAKKTPLEIAEKLNESGSHDLVLAALRAGA